MFTVYAIKSEVDDRVYVGLTSNVNRRLSEHNSGRVFSTKGYRPWHLFYTKDCRTRIEARTLEKQLKSGYGKEFLKSIIPG